MERKELWVRWGVGKELCGVNFMCETWQSEIVRKVKRRKKKEGFGGIRFGGW